MLHFFSLSGGPAPFTIRLPLSLHYRETSPGNFGLARQALAHISKMGSEAHLSEWRRNVSAIAVTKPGGIFLLKRASFSKDGQLEV